MNVFFDVQGTLISGGVPRPHARRVISELCSAGHDVYLWSSAGAGYAASAAEMLGVGDLIVACYSKSPPPPVDVDFAVDDFPDVAANHAGYHIAQFTGDPNDRELLEVPPAVAARGA